MLFQIAKSRSCISVLVAISVFIGLLSVRSRFSAPPELHIETLTIDFGDVPRGIEMRKELVVKNVGGSPLVIDAVAATCGCTRVTISRNEIENGGQAVMTCVFNSIQAKANDTTSIRISSNSINGEATIVVHANVVDDFTLIPPHFDFGRVQQTPISRDITIKANTARGRSLLNKLIGRKDSRIVLEIVPAQDESQRVLRATIPEGSKSGTLNVEFSLLPHDQPNLSVFAFGHLHGTHFCRPSSVVLATKAEQRITLHASDGKDTGFEISTIHVPVAIESVCDVVTGERGLVIRKIAQVQRSIRDEIKINLVTASGDSIVVTVPVAVLATQ